MQQKLYQIVDNIHGTIYYTDFEKSIISTPYFNRLHDVNQSSTVYLTFPPNRTKRYEHSLGTMQLTSDIFYHASVNSVGTDAIKFLFENAETEFDKIFKFVSDGNSLIFNNLGEYTDKTISQLRKLKKETFKENIETNFDACFSNNCLIHYAPNNLSNKFQSFLFLCLLQALRIAGLLHDCGHPPQSHIVESVLNELYDDIQMNVKEDKQTDRQASFVNIMSTYTKASDSHIQFIDEKMALKTDSDAKTKIDHLHEMVGLQITFNIFSQILPRILELKCSQETSIKKKIFLCYYLVITEFTLAIMRNKTDYWSSLHSIIDGTFDTDRLDFINRDSQNSGMSWGKIPYSRLINTVKLGLTANDSLPKRSKCLTICFSDKNIDLLDEILLNRYKIFTTINYHHRSTKIAMLYKRAIKILAQLYLQNSDEEDDTKPFFSDISGLWKSIKIVSSKHWSIMNIIQWNDSWLNGILYQTLVDGDTDGNDSESLQECCRCLEEIFLGQKRVFSLIKRNAELMEIYSAFSNSLKETIKKIKLEIVEVSKDIEKLNEEISDCKDKKYKTNLSNDLQAKTQARDLLQNTIDTITHDEYNLDYIATRLGCKTIFIDAITTVLDRHMDIIKKYNIEEVKFKLGTGDAYVYDYNDEIKSYYEYSRVKSIISDARNHFPYYYVYIQFSKQSNINTVSSKKLCEIRREIGTEMGRSVLDLLKGLVSFEHLS